MKKRNLITRRSTLKGIGALGAAGLLGHSGCAVDERIAGEDICKGSDVRKTIFDKVFRTPLVDTHEHLPDESERLKKAASFAADDWSVIFRHYLSNDMVTAGMSMKDQDMFFSRTVAPEDKWRFLAPYWPAVKNTGYGQAVRIAMKRLYDVDELSAETVKKVQAGYENTRKKGFYRRILQDIGGIESCQVNIPPFNESEDPTFLMQDLSIVGMIQCDIKMFGEPTGINIASIEDWHSAMDWWFQKYGKYAVAVKSQNAYDRDIDYKETREEEARPLFEKILHSEKVTEAEKKALEDHCFWYAVRKATQCNLPVKLHTGYYVRYGRMPLARLINNPGSACQLCSTSPDTQFVFMHICYPYYEEILSVAKHYVNANIDMCWAWIINPVAAKDFLKKYLVTAPANKILTFGGDYIPVEPALGHSIIARRGITLALSELVEEGWLSLDDALELTDPIMHGNARRIFKLQEKTTNLANAPWLCGE